MQTGRFVPSRGAHEYHEREFPYMRGPMMTEREALRISRRVLRLVRGYIAIQAEKDVLLTDGKGLMTWIELLNHIDGALSLKPRR